MKITREEFIDAGYSMKKDILVYYQLLDIKDEYKSNKELGRLISVIHTKFLRGKRMFLLGFNLGTIAKVCNISIETVDKYNASGWNMFKIYSNISKFID